MPVTQWAWTKPRGGVMIVAGIGCRANVDTDSVVEAIESALAASGMEPAALAALATVPEKAGEAAIVDAAHRLDVTLVVADPAAWQKLPRVA
jgi:cobalt-precorrin 5A hydrolase